MSAGGTYVCRFYLLIADGFDGVELRRFLCRIPSEEDACDGTDGEGEHNAPGLYEDGEVGYLVYHKCRAYPEDDAYQAALVEDQPYIWLYHQNDLQAYSTRIAEIPMDDFIWWNYEVWTWKLA